MIPQDGPTQADRIVGLFTWTFPSVCLLAVCNVLLNDAILFPVRIVGNRLPRVAQTAGRLANSTFNLAGAVFGYLWIHSACKPAVDLCSSNVLMNVECAKPVSLSLCAMFAISIWDRFFNVLFYPEYSSSFLSRMGEAGGVVIAWQLVGEREGMAALFVALLIARRARFAFPRVSKYGCGLLRLAIASIAFNALGKNCNTVSQKASVGILLSTLLLSSSCPQSLPQEQTARAAPVEQQARPRSPPPKRRRLPVRHTAQAPTAFQSFQEPTTTMTTSTATPRPSSLRQASNAKPE